MKLGAVFYWSLCGSRGKPTDMLIHYQFRGLTEILYRAVPEPLMEADLLAGGSRAKARRALEKQRTDPTRQDATKTISLHETATTTAESRQGSLRRELAIYSLGSSR